MAIPEDQLETWSHQGSVQQSARTYATVKRALEHPNAPYENRNFEVFLQGSYGNDTNIYSESDVDIVIHYKGGFLYDINSLPSDQQTLFHATFSNGNYPYQTFKAHVQAALETAFPASVHPGKKAIKIRANDSRRNADVVVAYQFRHYDAFTTPTHQSREPGIAFINSNGVRIANYPRQHAARLTAKHQATDGNFKPLVRIFKNMRTRLVDDGVIKDGAAPSYFIEGLLFNVPDENFSGSYKQIVYNVLSWLHQCTDRTNFTCANGRYFLLRDNQNNCWPVADCEQFISEVVRLWDHW
jgi:hypothetical protein